MKLQACYYSGSFWLTLFRRTCQKILLKQRFLGRGFKNTTFLTFLFGWLFFLFFFHPFLFNFMLINNNLQYNKEGTMLVLSAVYLCPEVIIRVMCH